MSDPERLFDSDPTARNAIGAARGDLPDAKQLQKIAAGVAGAAAATATGSAAASGLALKIILGVVVVGAIGTAAAIGMRSDPAPPPAVSSAASLPIPVLTLALTTSVEPTLAPPPSTSAPHVLSEGGVVDPDAQEMRDLDEAQRALATDPAKSLRLCDAQAKANPKGSMAQEREVIAIDALVRLGKTDPPRMDEAKTRALRFHERWPASAHGRRVDSLVASP